MTRNNHVIDDSTVKTLFERCFGNDPPLYAHATFRISLNSRSDYSDWVFFQSKDDKVHNAYLHKAYELFETAGTVINSFDQDHDVHESAFYLESKFDSESKWSESKWCEGNAEIYRSFTEPKKKRDTEKKSDTKESIKDDEEFITEVLIGSEAFQRVDNNNNRLYGFSECVGINLNESTQVKINDRGAYGCALTIYYVSSKKCDALETQAIKVLLKRLMLEIINNQAELSINSDVIQKKQQAFEDTFNEISEDLHKAQKKIADERRALNSNGAILSRWFETFAREIFDSGANLIEKHPESKKNVYSFHDLETDTDENDFWDSHQPSIGNSWLECFQTSIVKAGFDKESGLYKALPDKNAIDFRRSFRYGVKKPLVASELKFHLFTYLWLFKSQDNERISFDGHKEGELLPVGFNETLAVTKVQEIRAIVDGLYGLFFNACWQNNRINFRKNDELLEISITKTLDEEGEESLEALFEHLKCGQRYLQAKSTDSASIYCLLNLCGIDRTNLKLFRPVIDEENKILAYKSVDHSLWLPGSFSFSQGELTLTWPLTTNPSSS